MHEETYVMKEVIAGEPGDESLLSIAGEANAAYVGGDPGNVFGCHEGMLYALVTVKCCV